jgi:hypothetical protein
MNGELLAEGTGKECAEKLGMTARSFSDAAQRFKEGRYNKYYIYNVTDEKREEANESDRDVIKKWDDFVTPIRKHFGVPVWKGGK